MSAGAIAALAAALLIGLAGLAQGHDGNAHGGAAAAPPFTFGGPFDLLDHTGLRRTDRDFRGRFMLIYFGYVNCPDICPTNLQAMSGALDLLGEDGARIQPLFVSVDPARDTPDRLAGFVASFHPRLIGLTGSRSQIRAALKAYRVQRYKVREAEDAAPDNYLVLHTPTTFLMGPNGKFLSFFRHDGGAEVMAKALRKYLDGAGNEGS